MRRIYALCNAALCCALLSLLPVASWSDVAVTRDVVYGVVTAQKAPAAGAGAQDVKATNTAVDIPLKLDVYAPDGFAGKRPGIVVIHGGGWFSGDKGDAVYTAVSRQLADKGFVAFCIDYRLVPDFRYPAQLDDVQRAVRWIRAHSDHYHVDPERLGAWGDSAGGHLAALLGTRDTRDNGDAALAAFSSRVSCVVDLFGPADLTAPTSSLRFAGISSSLVVNFLGKKREEAPDLYREASPVTYVDKQSASFLIMHGDADPLVPVDQSRRLQEALQKAGVEATLIIMEKDYHGFRVPANQEKQKTATLGFFTRHLRP